MKMAIIGSGPLALFTAHHFDQLGAEVVLFQKNPLGGNARFLSQYYPKFEILFENKKYSIENFLYTKLIPIIENVEAKSLTKVGEVLRVHKRFLNRNEAIENRTRLHDLFRVIYSVNPKEAILKQLEENPEMFKQLGEQVIKSLHTPVESFEDFDLVIEATGFGKSTLPMGPSHAMALNENNLKDSSELIYGKDIFSKLEFSNQKNIVVIGDDESAILALLKCKDWLFKDQVNTLSWVTPAPHNKKYSNNWINQEFETLIKMSQTLFDQEKMTFEKKMHEWRDLEDYVKVKVPMPIEPSAKLKIYQGYNVTSVDRLLDRDGVFVTIEAPEFRTFANSEIGLKTLAADTILVASGVDTKETLGVGLINDEPGFYQLNAQTVDQGLIQIKNIEEKIMTFFSRASQ